MACEHATCLTLPAIFSFLQVHACSDRTPPSFVPLLSLVLASLALVPFLRESSGATAAQHEDAERAHDRLNTVLLAPLVAYIVGIWFCMLPPFPFTLALLAYVLFDAL
ncbi:hypothetical protein T492DRAFT_909702 [Pavlovales sp. CCMP2436]|nr:hypothetical protein T492DRAFT_909702 [Pavlovales sp. CCMP2436]